MAKPFKFRYVNELVGTFVLIVLALVIAGVFVIGRAQRWFEQDVVLTTTFPAEGTFGVQRGAEVQILGAVAGSVDRILVKDDGRLQAVFKIRNEFARYIHNDSVALVKKKFQVAGDSYVDITVGTGAPFPLDGSVELPIKKDTELLEIVQMVVEQVQGAILPALEELQKTLAAYRMLGEGLESPTGSLQRTMGNVEAITAGLKNGEGTAGRILRDPAIADEVGKILKQVNELLAKVQDTIKETDVIIKDLQKVSADLPAVSDTVKGELRDVPGVVLQARSTLQETEKLLVGIQRHWLLRDYVQQEHPLEAIPPEAVAAPKGGTP